MATDAKQDGFKLPEGYFEKFPERMVKYVREKNPYGVEPESGFRTPDKYFEAFGDRLQQRLSEKDKPVQKLRPLRWIWIPAAAAAILWLIIWSPSSPSTSLEFGDINAEALQAYLQNEDFDVTPTELAENLPLLDLAMEDLLDRAPETGEIAHYLEDYIESDEELYLESNE